EIEIEVVIEGRVDCGSSIRTKERIAVGGRTYDCFGGDIAGGACPVLDDEWLTEPLLERLTHPADEDVRSAATGICSDAAKRPRRIGLRPSEARHGRQRGSAGGQMQKLSAGKFHFEPPFTSFDHLVGEREQLRGHFEPESPRGLEVDQEFKFGGLHDREVRRPLAPEYATCVDATLAKCLTGVGTIRHQAAG